jgi:signal peptidase II
VQESRRTEIARRPRTILLAAALATVAADQLTKQAALAALRPGERAGVIGSFFGFKLTRNSGGAFGILPGAPWLFFAASAVIVVAVVAMGWNRHDSSIALGVIAGGGIGNLLDRIFRAPALFHGKVVDFIDFPFWPTFNLADSAIVIGVAILFYQSLVAKSPRSSQTN